MKSKTDANILKKNKKSKSSQKQTGLEFLHDFQQKKIFLFYSKVAEADDTFSIKKMIPSCSLLTVCHQMGANLDISLPLPPK